MQVSRLFGIVHLLIEKKCVAAKDLAARFEVSIRTIYRDVEALSAAGIPVYATQGRGGGICILDRYVLNKAVLSEEEQTQILTALSSVCATHQQSAQNVLSKLSSLFQKKDTNWIEFDFFGWEQNDCEKIKFEQLKEAVLSHNAVKFTYHSSKGERSQRDAEPLKLVFKGHSWYLYAYCCQRQDYRFFKLTRISDLLLTDEIFSRTAPPIAFMRKNDAQMVNLVIKFAPEMAFRVYDEFKEIEICDDGSLIARQQVSIDEWLVGYILSYGAQAEVIEPEFIRNMIGMQVKSLHDCYLT